MKPVSLRSRTTTSVAAEWDKLAPLRVRQIESGADHSAREVLGPAVITLLGRRASVLDVGCGTGWLAGLVSDHVDQVTGVDASRTSIRLACRTVRKRNVNFLNTPIEKFANSHPSPFSAAVANMTLSTVTNLPRVLSAIHRCLQSNGVFVFTIPHPCFWPTYWGYAEAPWFKYDTEIAIAAPFRIASEGTAIVTTHVHRPLQQYLTMLKTAGFELERFRELIGRGFAPPRFIAMRWQTRSTGRSSCVLRY
jgi:ubiquinone/menaquinone biosynthesis C-methylase UbiE